MAMNDASATDTHTITYAKRYLKKRLMFVSLICQKNNKHSLNKVVLALISSIDQKQVVYTW